MANAKYCDRCGELFKGYEFCWGEISGFYGNKLEYELCETCRDLVEPFFEGKSIRRIKK